MIRKDLEKEFLNHISRNEDMVHKICNIYASCYEERQDLKQEIVYQLWRSFPSFRGESKFRPGCTGLHSTLLFILTIRKF